MKVIYLVLVLSFISPAVFPQESVFEKASRLQDVHVQDGGTKSWWGNEYISHQ